MTDTRIPLPSDFSNKTLSFEDFVIAVRDGANSGIIQAPKNITLYDLAICWVLDVLRRGFGGEATVIPEQLWHAMRAFFGTEKAEELEGSAGEEIIVHGGFNQ